MMKKKKIQGSEWSWDLLLRRLFQAEIKPKGIMTLLQWFFTFSVLWKEMTNYVTWKQTIGWRELVPWHLIRQRFAKRLRNPFYPLFHVRVQRSSSSEKKNQEKDCLTSIRCEIGLYKRKLVTIDNILSKGMYRTSEGGLGGYIIYSTTSASTTWALKR